MDEKIKIELEKIVNTLTATGIVSQIFLFGSYAKGVEKPDSDIDLCVLTTVKDQHPLDVGVDLRMKLNEIQTMPMDLLAYNSEHFYHHAKRQTSFEYEIAKNGVLLYEHR